MASPRLHLYSPSDLSTSALARLDSSSRSRILPSRELAEPGPMRAGTTPAATAAPGCVIDTSAFPFLVTRNCDRGSPVPL